MERRNTILIVDDVAVNRIILHSIFEKTYEILEAENGQQAMVLIAEHHMKLAAVLLDIVMPIMDGYEVMTEMAANGYLAEAPVVIITAENSAENEIQAFDLGASDIIMKPFEPHVVQRRVQNIIELNFRKINQDEIIEEQANKIRESNAVMVDTLSSIIEYRSVETGQHVRRIGVYTKTLLEDVAANYPEYLLNEHEISLITSASSMHDIGKIAIPDSILNKPGRLTAEEFEIMKTHTIKGCEIMSNLEGMDEDYIQYAYNICRYHHERWDGCGYPDGLHGDGIPICAQVVAIADCYDALTNDRVYKKKLPHDQAVNMILNGECGLFSPKILESLKNVQESFLHFSRQYADHAPREMTSVERAPSVKTASRQDKALDTLQMAQMKYYAMLKYADATVMEVDFATGVYHVVYRSSPDFELLQTGNRFEESIKAFVEGSVHPDDRKKALRVLGDYSEEFFETGMMKRVRQYRVYNHAERTYCWCSAAMLRIDAESPAQRKAIVVWRETDPIDAEVRSSWSQDEEDMIKNLVGGVQICRADRWFTMPTVNQSLLDLLGYTAEEVRRNFGNRFINIIHPEDRDDILKAASEQATRGNQLDFEYRLMAKGGRTLWVLEKTRVMTGEDGQSHYYSILIDVTQSKKAQDAPAGGGYQSR